MMARVNQIAGGERTSPGKLQQRASVDSGVLFRTRDEGLRYDGRLTGLQRYDRVDHARRGVGRPTEHVTGRLVDAERSTQRAGVKLRVADHDSLRDDCVTVVRTLGDRSGTTIGGANAAPSCPYVA